MTSFFRHTLIATACLLSASLAQAQVVTLKVHHFLPANSGAQTKFIKPWCDKIAAESNNQLKCQIYPSMQLGGTPPQLVDQVKDGTVDVIWTLTGYSAGRYPRIEVFELPFMMQSAEATSKALWDYMQAEAPTEFKDMHPLAFHVHGDGVFHIKNKPITTKADFAGLKLRAPTRQTNAFLASLGATPVAMPVPAVSESLAKGVIDGAVLPYEVMPSVKVQELVKFHSETDPASPAFYTATFVFAMNNDKYASLPANLKKVIDDNSGRQLSGLIGKTFSEIDTENKKLAAKNTTNIIPKSELATWQGAADSVKAKWISDVAAKGADGQKLYDAARAAIARASAKP